MFSAIWRKIKAMAHNFSENLGAAIDAGDKRGIIGAVVCLILTTIGIAGLIAGVALFVVLNAKFLFTWIGIPVFVGWVLVYWLTSAKPVEDIEDGFDPIDEELVRQRGLEMCDLVFSFMLAVIIKVSCNTKLSRPHNECDIQRTTVNRDPLVIKDGVIVYLVECDLDAPIDTAEKDTMREALQRQAVREINRFPSLISKEAQGRAPVEILDVLNVQNHVMIQVVFTSAASLKMIDSSRRARLERQQKQQTYVDADYTE